MQEQPEFGCLNNRHPGETCYEVHELVFETESGPDLTTPSLVSKALGLFMAQVNLAQVLQVNSFSLDGAISLARLSESYKVRFCMIDDFRTPDWSWL